MFWVIVLILRQPNVLVKAVSAAWPTSGRFRFAVPMSRLRASTNAWSALRSGARTDDIEYHDQPDDKATDIVSDKLDDSLGWSYWPQCWTSRGIWRPSTAIATIGSCGNHTSAIVRVFEQQAFLIRYLSGWWKELVHCSRLPEHTSTSPPDTILENCTFFVRPAPRCNGTVANCFIVFVTAVLGSEHMPSRHRSALVKTI